MRVPKEEWFTRSLLYWDKFYLIVPEDIETSVDNYTKELHESGLVEYVRPEYALKQPGAQRFANKFISFMDIVPWQQWQVVPRGSPNTNGGADRLPSNLVDFYDAKFTYSARNELQRRRLMFEPRTKPGWFEMHPCTAYMYMGCLAVYLADLLPDCSPVTYNASHLLWSPDRPQEEAERKLAESRAIVLDGILPAPQGGISAKAIADFKAEHKSERRELRSEIETALTQIADISNPTLRQRRIDIFLGILRHLFRPISRTKTISEALRGRSCRNTGIWRGFDVASQPIIRPNSGGVLWLSVW